uniref:Uncharacterized protein n=1 Tax=Salix viminalis TaxID=40686 RepID=A0A6N2MC66_SALVM
MDLKGITWVGDIYQKFEARLLEVEEIMCEEAVKYVENQMQTVSDNVRKFYSDVMQDLSSPDPEDPANGAVSKLPVDLGADVGVHMKPDDGMKETCGKVDDMKQLIRDSKMTTDNGPDRLTVRERISVRRISRQHSRGILSNESNLGMHENSNCKNVSPKETSGITAPSNKHLIRHSTISKLPDQNLEASCDWNARLISPGSFEVTDHFSIEKSKNAIENAREHVLDVSFYKPSLDMSNITETGRHEGTASRPSCGNVLEESNATGACLNNGLDSMIEFSANGNMQTKKFAYEEDCVSNSDEWGIDSDKEGALIEEDMEIIQQMHKARLEETCILMKGDELHNVHRKGENKPYKKKIRDVFRSRNRSVRKEYEQLAVQFSSDPKSNQEESKTSLMATLSIKEANTSASHPSESEWELV